MSSPRPLMPVGPRVPFSITRIAVSADSRDVLLAGATLVVHWRDGHRSDWISTSAPIRALGFVRDDAWLLVDGEDAGPMELATDDGLDGLHFDAPVVAAALAGGRLFTVDGAGRLGAFDVAGWEVLASGALAGATGLAASPDGTLVAVVLPDGVALCDSELALVSRLAVSEVVGVAVGDAHLAVKTRGGFAVFTHAGGPVAAWAASEVSAFAISPSGTVCGATDGAVTAWRCDGSPAWSAPFDGRPTAVAWCHGSFWVGDRGVGRYAEVDGTGPPTEGPASQVTHLQALGDRKLVSRHGARWWVSGPEGVRSFHYPGASRVQLVDGGFLASGQQVLARLDAEGTEVTRYAIPAGILCSAAAASPDGGAIAVAGYVGELALLDAGTGSVRWRTVAHAHLVGAVVFSADGRWLSSRTLSDVPRVWSCADGTPASRPACFGQQVVGAGFQGDELVTLHPNGVVRWWSAATGELGAEVATGLDRTLLFAVGARQVAVGTRLAREIRLVDRDGTLGSLPGHDRETLVLAWDGATLLSGGDDGVTLIWNPDDARALERVAVPAVEPRRRGRTSPEAVAEPDHDAVAMLVHGQDQDGWTVVQVGELALPSGELVVADPHLADGSKVIEPRLPPGRYPVRLVMDTRTEEVLAVGMRVSAGEPTSWSSAFGARGGEPLGASVDSASLVWVDATWATAVWDDGPDGPALLPLDSAAQTNGLHGSAARNLLHVSTGRDGGFPVYVGVDRHGAAVWVVVPIG